LKELFQGITNRFTGSALASALSGGLHLAKAPPNTPYPYAVYFMVSGKPEWTFTEDMENVLLQFSIFDSDLSALGICDLYAKLDALYHDCDLAVTGYDCLYMLREFQQLQRDEEEAVWQYNTQFQIMLEKL